MNFTKSKNIRNLLNKFNPMYRKNTTELEEMSKEDLIYYIQDLYDEIRATQTIYYSSGIHEGKRCMASDLWGHHKGILAFTKFEDGHIMDVKGPNWEKRDIIGWEATMEEKCIEKSNLSNDMTDTYTIYKLMKEK